MQNSDFSKNTELLELAASGDSEAIDRLVFANMGLVKSIANRFRDRIEGSDMHGCDFEDLIQIGTIGMIKAIKSFDISFGTAFSTYAVPLIIGEIKRFLRDDGLIKISRSTKKLNASILREREDYLRKYGREPTVDELAEICKISTDELIFALESGNPCHSLNDTVGDDGVELVDFLSNGECEIDALCDRIALKEAIASLPLCQRQIILLRYFRDMSQQETAEMLGLTQVKVSREEKKIFEKLRQVL